LFGNLINYMIGQQLIEPSYIDLIRINIYKTMGHFLA